MACGTGTRDLTSQTRRDTYPQSIACLLTQADCGIAALTPTGPGRHHITLRCNHLDARAHPRVASVPRPCGASIEPPPTSPEHRSLLLPSKRRRLPRQEKAKRSQPRLWCALRFQAWDCLEREFPSLCRTSPRPIHAYPRRPHWTQLRNVAARRNAVCGALQRLRGGSCRNEGKIRRRIHEISASAALQAHLSSANIKAPAAFHYPALL